MFRVDARKVEKAPGGGVGVGFALEQAEEERNFLCFRRFLVTVEIPEE